MKEMIIVDLVLRLGERSEKFRMALNDYCNQKDSIKNSKNNKAENAIYHSIKKELDRTYTCLSSTTKKIINTMTFDFLESDDSNDVLCFLNNGAEIFTARILDYKNKDICDALFEFKELQDENSWDEFKRIINPIVMLEIFGKYNDLFKYLSKTKGKSQTYERLSEYLLSRVKEFILKSSYKDLEVNKILWA